MQSTQNKSRVSSEGCTDCQMRLAQISVSGGVLILCRTTANSSFMGS